MPTMLYIFKTTVKKKKDVKAISRIFEASNNILHFNFDLEDCDKILRVKSESLKATEILSLISHLGHDCEELDL
ncbi:hypothetical protein [Flavobacterium sp. CAU 1735]|uniref:hypothetical protein n=1 Tax=Flavobacterium sp. CAU 1735 TaxID=3140361 RepID=UPI0032600D48